MIKRCGDPSVLNTEFASGAIKNNCPFAMTHFGCAVLIFQTTRVKLFIYCILMENKDNFHNRYLTFVVNIKDLQYTSN